MADTPPKKLLAEWFWTDRWIGSSGFLLPMEARGIYREMLTQAWRRGGRLPHDTEAVCRAIGVTDEEWQRSWPLVEKYWRIEGADIVNDTQLEVYAEAKRRAEAESERNSRAGLASAEARRKSTQVQHTFNPGSTGVPTTVQPASNAPSPSPSPSPIPSQSPNSDPNKKLLRNGEASSTTSRNGHLEVVTTPSHRAMAERLAVEITRKEKARKNATRFR